MSAFDVIAILISLAAVFGYFNHRHIGLPTTIGLMLLALAFSLVLIAVGTLDPGVSAAARAFVEGVDFNEAVLGVMLSYLLFAGALHVDLGDLASQRRIIAILATFGVVFSTFAVGTVAFFALPLFGLEAPFIFCLLFGALISPTDPVAVLGILRKAGAPKSLETKITGESLFNDGVGVVVFLTILGIATGRMEASAGGVALLFAQEVAGGLLLGLALGYAGFWMLKRVDQYQVEILITLAMVTGGYSLALHLHVSGPLAMVVAGLMTGNQGRKMAMSPDTKAHLDTFWELVDEILNALLFLLIGLEVLVLDSKLNYLLFGALAIPVALGARMVAVAVPVTLLKRRRSFSPKVIRALTWGGLRGGISVALALSLPPGELRDVFLTATYIVVIFSIAVQGLTLKHALPTADEA